jgi:hypothetical protein
LKGLRPAGIIEQDGFFGCWGLVDWVVAKEMAFEAMIAEADFGLGCCSSTSIAKWWMLERREQHCLQAVLFASLTESFAGW